MISTHKRCADKVIPFYEELRVVFADVPLKDEGDDEESGESGINPNEQIAYCRRK